MRKKTRADKAHSIAAEALASFGRTVSDLHLAADLLDEEAERAYDAADAHYGKAREAEKAGVAHNDTAGQHRRAAERIAALIGD